MEDSSRGVAAEADAAAAEADAAAADAASDARAEVLERAKKSSGATGKAKAPLTKAAAAKAAKAKDTWHRFGVDVWITPFNSVEFGLYKRSRNRGKSRQFTSDMDIFAEITENGERTGLLGFRKEAWNDATGMDKRLVLKLFSASLNWQATMDMMIGRSLASTLGARGLPVTSFSINTNDDDFIVYLERSANKWPFLPENFSFFVMRDGVPSFYRLRRDLIDLGGDYTLLDQHNEVVGHLNGAVFTIGGRWKCRVRSDHADKRLLAVVKMFPGFIIFSESCRRHVKHLAKEVKAGRLTPALDAQESDLYMNPRRVR